MASKRSSRTSRPADQEKAIGVHDRRDDAAIRPRLLLTAAVLVVVLTGAFAGKRSLGDAPPMKQALTGPIFRHLLSICFCAMQVACHGIVKPIRKPKLLQLGMFTVSAAMKLGVTMCPLLQHFVLEDRSAAKHCRVCTGWSFVHAKFCPGSCLQFTQHCLSS